MIQLEQKYIEIFMCSQISSRLNSKYPWVVSLQGASRDAGIDVSGVAIAIFKS
jgi:hypothetical protein